MFRVECLPGMHQPQACIVMHPGYPSTQEVKAGRQKVKVILCYTETMSLKTTELER